MTKIPDTDSKMQSVHQTAPVPSEVFTTRESLRERCEVALRCLPQAPMRDRLARLFEDLLADQWRPIKTAPKNAFVLLWVDIAIGHPLIEQGCWFEISKREKGWIDRNGEIIQATHWMPLPAAPHHRSAVGAPGSNKTESDSDSGSSFAAQGMAQDAARYRHLRSRCPQWLLEEVFGGPIADSKREAQELLDAAIDSLRAVPHQPTGERE